jgi:hypothetical protein
MHQIQSSDRVSEICTNGRAHAYCHTVHMIVLPIYPAAAGLLRSLFPATALVLVVLRQVVVRIPGSSMLTSPSIASLCQPTRRLPCAYYSSCSLIHHCTPSLSFFFSLRKLTLTFPAKVVHKHRIADPSIFPTHTHTYPSYYCIEQLVITVQKFMHRIASVRSILQ